MTTLANLTDSQIRALKTEARTHGDDKMAVICDIALGERVAELADGTMVSLEDYPGHISECYSGYTLSSADWTAANGMDQDEAREAAVEAISDSAAQG